jgi:hypothetical protein
MPPQQRDQLSQVEGRIALAVQAFKQGQFAHLKTAAKAYDVPHSTLRRRINGQLPRRDIRPHNMKLTITEESTLVQWILDLDRRGLPPRIDYIRQLANLLLSKRGMQTESKLEVGKQWTYSFIRRHTELQTRYNRKYDYQRAKCEDPTLIRNWFSLVRNIITKYGITKEDIYNFDETGFQMGVISAAKVVTGSERRAGKPISIQPGNRTWITVVETICSLPGRTVPPMIILDGKQHQNLWYYETDNWFIGVSDNGWINDSLALLWLQKVFNEHTKHRITGKYRLLILDGHGSHHTPEFDLFCSENLIITLYMPPHSSHLLQPLDVACFAPLKMAYSYEVMDFMRMGFNSMDKEDFLEIYQRVRIRTFTSAIIESAFTATGLIPDNPDQVLSKLNIQLRTPTPPVIEQPLQQPWIPETPHNVRELELQATAIRRRHVMSSPTDHALGQLIKGCEIAMNNAVLLADEVRQLRAANERKKRKQSRKRLYIAIGGVLSTQEGIELSQQAVEREEARAIDRAARATAALQRTPRKCSGCKSIGHNSRTCPLRVVSN